MIVRFPKSMIVLSMVTNQMTDYVYNIHGIQVVSPPNIQTFDNAITVKGAPLPNCFGFIDGTVRPLCRPGEQQRILCNGHKRVLCPENGALLCPMA